MDIGHELLKTNIPFKESYRYFVTNCPKHTDTHPSLKIYKDSERCHCYSCGYNVPFIVFLKENHNIVLNEVKQSKSSPEKFYHKIPERVVLKLPKGFTKCEEVLSLGLDKEVIDFFNIGYCKYGYNSKKTGICSDCFFNRIIDEVNYTTDSGHCYFVRNRVMIPVVHDKSLYTIESRDLSGKSSRKVLYPVKSKTSKTIFNYNNLDRKKPLYVVEGIKSAISFWKRIDKNVTAIFSNRVKGIQSELLREFEIIFIIPDKGRAGEQMVEDIVRINKNSRVVSLPKEVLCKDCKTRFFGEEKVQECPSCGSKNNSFCDVFDFDTDIIKDAISIANEVFLARSTPHLLYKKNTFKSCR